MEPTAWPRGCGFFRTSRKNVIVESAVPPQKKLRLAMPGIENAKKILEKATGIARPKRDALPSLLRERKANLLKFKDDGETPNNPALPLIHYRSPLELDASFDPAAIFEELFSSNGWNGSWRDGVYPFLHFHTKTHEVLGIARGEAHVKFGGKRGRTIHLRAGDVIILPAGTGHRRHSASRDLLVVGAYPDNSGKYDEPQPKDVDLDEARKAVAKVRLPARDPVYGAKGPLKKHWSARRDK
jgi:uncharacterized protein YjlB